MMDWRMVPSEQLVSEAAEWFARIHDPELPTSVREEFTRWVLQSPAHIAAYLKVTRSWGDIGLAGENMPGLEELVETARASSDHLSNVVGMPSNVVALPTFMNNTTSEIEEPEQSWWQRSWKGVAAAGVATLALAVPLGWMAIDHYLNPSHIQTAVGEQRSIALADGSLVQLNTNSELRVELKDNERRIVLERGEARFTVAKDPKRPFVVRTPQATVRALGTVFNVQIAAQGTDVAVLEGHVEVAIQPQDASRASESESPTQLAKRLKEGTEKGSAKIRPEPNAHLREQEVAALHLVLGSGEQAAVTPEGKILPDVGPPIERVVGWTDRRLVFREETLATLIAEVNRYHPHPIRIVDPEIAGLRISGTFAAYDLPSLIQYLERYRGVRSQPSAEGGLELYKAQ
jgi:transmembrane sensor